MSPVVGAIRSQEPLELDGVPPAPAQPLDDLSRRRAAKPTAAPARKRGRTKSAVYVYARTSERTGITYWWGDFRRFRDVGGKQEALAKYLRPGEAEIDDEERAITIYWRGVEVYQEKRRLKEGGTTPAIEATPAATTPASSAPQRATALAPAAESSAASSTRGLPDPSIQLASVNVPSITAVAGSVAPSAVAPNDTVALFTQLLASLGMKPPVGAHLRLGAAADAHLKWKRAQAAMNVGTSSTCDTDETYFKSLRRLLGEETLLKDIDVERLERYIATRLTEPGWKKKAKGDTTISTTTVRNELITLSGLFTQLSKRGEYTLGNPVSQVTLPAAAAGEAEYLQPAELARFLDAAVLIDRETATAKHAMSLVHRARSMCKRGHGRPAEAQALLDEAEDLYPTALRSKQSWHRRFSHVEVLFASYIYTGGRSEEVRGLAVEEVDWERDDIIYRHNESRPLKREHCRRRVPMGPVPEYRTILKRYLDDTGLREGLLLPSDNGGMLGGLQTIFTRCAQLAGIDREVSTHSLRHSYATAMLNTYTVAHDGRSVQRSAHQVAKLLGQKDSKLIDETYGHLIWDARMRETFSLDALRRFPSTRNGGAPEQIPSWLGSPWGRDVPPRELSPVAAPW